MASNNRVRHSPLTILLLALSHRPVLCGPQRTTSNRISIYKNKAHTHMSSINTQMVNKFAGGFIQRRNERLEVCALWFRRRRRLMQKNKVMGRPVSTFRVFQVIEEDQIHGDTVSISIDHGQKAKAVHLNYIRQYNILWKFDGMFPKEGLRRLSKQ